MDLLIPNFTSAAAIEQWISTFSDKDIQSWTSRNFIDVLFACHKFLGTPEGEKEVRAFFEEKNKAEIAKLKKEKKEREGKLQKCMELKEQAKEKEALYKDYEKLEQDMTNRIQSLEKIIEEKKKYTKPINETTKETPLDKDVNSKLKRRDYIKTKYPEIFNKLYINYRLDPEIKEYLVKIGKEIGKKLAHSTNIETSALALNMEKRQEYAEVISNTVFSYCFPYVDEKDAESAKHTISIDKNLGPSGDTYWDKILISDRRRDHFLRTIAHECIHAYMQVDKKFAFYLWNEQGIFPEGYRRKNETKENQNVKDFFLLLNWNLGNYWKSSALDGVEESKEEKDRRFKAYQKEPVEKHASFLANIIEHVYRQETRKYSERNSVDLYNNYTRNILGEPIETKHKDSNAVTHKYKITDRINLQKVEDTFETLDPLLKKEMNIREEDGCVLYDVPETWSARCKIKAFIEKMNTNEGKSTKAHIIAQEIARQAAQNKK